MLNETILVFIRGSKTVSCSLVHSIGGIRYRAVGGESVIDADDEVAVDDVVEVDILRRLSIRLLPLLVL